MSKKNATCTSHIFNHRNGKIELAPENNESSKGITPLERGESTPVRYQSLRHSEIITFLCPHLW